MGRFGSVRLNGKNRGLEVKLNQTGFFSRNRRRRKYKLGKRKGKGAPNWARLRWRWKFSPSGEKSGGKKREQEFFSLFSPF